MGVNVDSSYSCNAASIALSLYIDVVDNNLDLIVAGSLIA